MNIINDYLTGLVRTYVADYLDNFDMRQLNFSLLKGALELNRLQLNSKILDNSPLPLKLKYGRIGQVRIEVPNLLKLTSGIIDVRVSDVFVCLESRPFSEWIDNTIIDEFHGSKESSLRTFEEEAKTFYIQHQGEQQEMSATVLSLIQNIQVTIERVYLRIEDPYPFALGLLIPSITLKTANETWKVNEKNANTELAFKIVRIEGFSIFMERDPEEVSIDQIIGLAEKPGMSFAEREDKLYSHIADIFAGVGGTTSQVFLNGGQASPSKVAKKISSFDFILQAFDIDMRLQLIIDKVRAKKTAPNEPHVKVSILCGGLFGESKKDPIMRLEIREDQINALTQFSLVTGLYNTYKAGVLHKFFEKEFDPESLDIQRYMVLYEDYLAQVLVGNQEEMDDSLSLLREIEREYQTDIIVRLRRALCERFFGFRKADAVREERLKELERQQRRAAGLPADENTGEMSRTKKVIEFITKGLFGGRNEEQTGLPQSRNLEPQLTPQQRQSRVKQINFVRAFIRSFYRSRYNLLIDEIVAISKGLQGDDVVLTPQENSTMDISLSLPKLTLRLLEEKTSQVNEPRMLLEIGIEEVAFTMNTESKPVYSIQTINLKNLYIKDPHSPVPAMPYLLQLVLDQDLPHYHTQPADSLSRHNQQALRKDEWAIEIELETNPRGREGFNRAKLHTKGQLYLYGNLEFAKNLVQFAGRVTNEMGQNNNKMLEKAPPAINDVIKSGKDIDKKLAEKKERAQKEKDEREKYTKPKTDLDIFLRAPKVILYEGLLGESPIVQGQADAIIIDLGQIQLQTKLIKFDKNTDYNQIFDPKDLYDCMLVKLGKVKIFADFKLRLDELDQRSNHSLKWSPSYHMRADITNEINLGCEIHTCLAPNHPTLPASIINAKVEQIKLQVSRRVVQTLLRFIGIYHNGSFNMTLSGFLESQEVVSQPEGNDIAEDNDSSEILSESQILLQQQEPKPPAPAGRSEITWLVQKIGIVVEELVELESSHQAGRITQVEKYIQKLELSEIGLKGLKGRLETQDKRMQCQAFLEAIYIKHAKAKSERYRYVIGNPKLEKIDIEEFKTHNDVFTKMQGINSQMRSDVNHQHNQIIEARRKHGSGDADFSFFTTFDPSLEFQNETNQLAVLYVSEELDTHEADWTLSQMTVDATIRNLRITFLAPGLKNVLRFYVGLMVDIKDVPKQMKAEFEKRYGYVEEEEKINSHMIIEEDLRHSRSQNLYSKDGRAKLGKGKQPIRATFKQAVNVVKDFQKKERERKELEKEKALKETGLSHKKVTEKMIIKATVSDLEVMVPENLYEFPSQALKITLGCDFTMNSSSDYKDTYKNDRAHTLLDHELKKSESVMKISLKELAIYLEKQLSKEDVPAPQEPGMNHHLLAPFPLVIDMFSQKTLHSSTNTDSKSIICISGGPIGVHLGLREVNNYLVIAQLIMQFLNDLTIMQQEIDWRAKAKVQEIQRKIKRRIKIEQLLETDGRFNPRDVMDEDEKRRLAEKEDKIVTLDEILANEGLKKKEVTAAKARWKRALQKLNTLSTERHFLDSRIQIDVRGLTVKIIDNSDLNQKPKSLLGLEVGELQMKMCTRSYEKMKNVMMERWFKIDNVDKSYSYLRLQLELTGSYYNCNSFAEEMFIEPFPLVIKISQKSPMSNSSQIILSREMFNINASYGLVCNVKRIMNSLLKVENDQKAEEARLQWQGTSGPIFEESMYEPMFKSLKQLPSSPKHPLISNGLGQQPQEQKINTDNLEVKFFNHTGLPVRFTLSLLKIPLLAIKESGQIVKDKRIRVLPPANPAAQGEQSLNITAKVLEADLSEFSQQNSQRLKQGFLKIDFTIGSFRKVTKVNLQKSGIFGYYLHEDDGRTSNFNTFERSNMSCIVNIQRINNSIHVSFESSLILLNDTSFNLSLKTTNRFNIDQDFTLRPGQVHIAPVTWFVDQAFLIHSDLTETTHVFDDHLTKIFDPRIIFPTQNHAKILKQSEATTRQRQYFSSDIFMLKTKTAVGQFLLVFNPLLKVFNLLFTELLIKKHASDRKEDYNIIKSNTTEPMYEINPYNPVENKVDMRYKEDDNLEYEVEQVALKTKGLQENKVCGFTEGQYLTFNRDIRPGVVDQTVDREIYVALEKIGNGHTLRNTEYNDFSVRRQAYSSTMSITYVLYFPYIAINKTNIDLQLVEEKIKRTVVNAFSSTYLQPQIPKMHLEVSGYDQSEEFGITTFGVSGTLVMKQLKPGAKQDSNPQLMDSDLVWETQHFLEIGSFFNNCPAPYSKTKLLYFVPRYILKNKLDYPIVVKERNGFDQIVLKPDSERYFNLGQDSDSGIMIRALNQQKEQKAIPIMQPIQSESGQIDIPSVQRRTVTDGVRSGDGGQLESAVKSSRRRVTETYEFDLDKEYVKIDKSHDPMKTWSYYFSVKNVDDFQLTVPNLNSPQLAENEEERMKQHLDYQKQNGWQKTIDHNFVRVNISPGPEHEATLFVSFHKPFFPEYIFYNSLDTYVLVQHKSTAINADKKNCVYKLSPNSHKAIVLNPNDKDEDFLIITVLDDSGQRPSNSEEPNFIYEIDSLKQHYPQRAKANARQYTVITKLSGSLRFIKLMSNKAWNDEKARRRLASNRQVPDDQSEAESADDDNDVFQEALKGALDFDHDFDDEVETADPNAQSLNASVDNLGRELGSTYEVITDTDVAADRVGVRIKGIHGSQRERSKKISKMYEVVTAGDQGIAGQEVTKSLLYINILGITLSLVSSDPREILLLSLHDIVLQRYNVFTDMEDIHKNHQKMNFTIKNMQIDNMLSRSFKVILGPRKPFNFRQSAFRALTKEQHEKEQDGQFFLQLYLDQTNTKEGGITAQRIKQLDVALQEINVNAHSYAINHILYFVTSLTSMLSDELITNFMDSDTMFNYARLMSIMSMEDDYLQLLIGAAPLAPDHEAKKSLEFQQMEFHKLEQYKNSVRRLMKGLKDNSEVEWNQIDQFFNLDTSKQNQGKNLQAAQSKMTHNKVMTEQEYYKNQNIKRKEEVVPSLSSDAMTVDERQDYNQSKILVQEISIKAIRLFLTFRMKDLETAMGSSGFLADIVNFLSSFTNISDASLYFKQIEIKNAYKSKDSIISILSTHYISQGINQIYKILGATDIIGNPVGLISNLGRGVEELYSEPFQGVLSGDMSRAAKGLGRGVIGFGKNAAFGIGSSLSRMTGTWYVGLRGFSGRQVSESNLDDPHSIGSGLKNGTVGLGKEIAQGTTGIVKVPKKTMRDSGKTFNSCIKGTCHGIVGFAISPVTGLLKMVYSFSTGIKNQSGDTQPAMRFRFPRYFNDMDVLEPYDPVLSHAQASLYQASGDQNTWFKEVILFAMDVSGFTDLKEHRFKDRVLLVTDKRLLFVQSFSKVKLNLLLRTVIQVESYETSLIFRTNDNGKIKDHKVDTGKRPFANGMFKAQLERVLENKMKNKLQAASKTQAALALRQ